MIPQPEPWLRGPIEGVDPLRAPILYAFRQAREDLAHWTEILTDDQIWFRPAGLAPIGFQLRHIAGSVDRLIGTVAVSRAGVPFESLDGEPVHVFVMLISPKDRPGDHLRALENVSRNLRDDTFVRSLRQVTSRDMIWGLLTDQEHGS